MPVALIVEADVQSRALLASYVRRVRGMSVTTASSVEEVRLAARIDPPDVLVTAWKLPDGTGADVVEVVCARRQISAALVVLDEDEPEVNPEAISTAQRVRILRRPISSHMVHKLLQRSIRETLDRQPLLGPAEYLQLACMGHHTAVVECSREGAVVGEIFVSEGQIWSAVDDLGDGVEAFRRLVRSDSLARLKVATEPPPRNIEGQWEHLLLEAARREDEESTRHELSPDALDDSEVSRKVDEQLRAAARCVLRRDLKAAAQHFAAAAELRPDDTVIQHNLERLRTLGYQSDVEDS